MYSKKRGAREKHIAIIGKVWHRELTGRRTSIYAIAKDLGYTPNGSFSNSVWECVDKGLLDARPVSCGNRFAWQLTLTASGYDYHERERSRESNTKS